MRRTKWNVLILASALALTFLGARAAAALQPAKQDQSGQTKKREATQDSAVYRVTYKVNEIKSGKTVNSRSYTLMVKPGTPAVTRVGSRVPVIIPGKSVDYQSIGIFIRCRITEDERDVFVKTSLNINTAAGEGYSPSSGEAPVLRQMSLDDDTSAVIGKTALVGMVDDTTSNQHYVIEVTVTKAK